MEFIAVIIKEKKMLTMNVVLCNDFSRYSDYKDNTDDSTKRRKILFDL